MLGLLSVTASMAVAPAWAETVANGGAASGQPAAVERMILPPQGERVAQASAGSAAGDVVTLAPPGGATKPGDTPAASPMAAASNSGAAFTFTAEKAADGTVTFSGNVPDKDVDNALGDAIHVAADNTTVKTGAPADFSNDAVAAPGVLNTLDSGKITFDGSSWSIAGQVDSADKATAASALFGASPLKALGAAYDVAAPATATAAAPPAQPPAAPATSASAATPVPLAAANAASSPTPAVTAAPSSAPASATPSPAAVAAPAAPSNTTATSASGAAAPTTAGTAAPSAATATTAPTAPSAATPPAAATPGASASTGATASSPASSASAVSGAATASTPPVAAPVPAAPAYTFGGQKPEGGAIALAGEVPSPVARIYFAQRAGNVPPDGLSVASGAPDDFVPSALAGIDALDQLDAGNLAFDGKAWSLSGKAGSLDARDTALAVIGALPAGKDWKVDITGPSEVAVCTQIVTPFLAANPINFDARTTHFSKGAEPVLDTLAKDLALCPATRVNVQGNTDSDGAAAANMALSVARAEAVVAALTQRGIAPQRLYAIGYGETLPLVPNTTKANKAKNRRIDFGFEAMPGK